MGANKGTAWRKQVQLVERLTAVPDSELIIGGNTKPLPIDHWCEGCPWGSRMHDRYMCPFVEGSCVRLPGSMEHPAPEILHSRITYDRLYTDAHADVFTAIEG